MTPSGWYLDPGGSGALRWWDGSAWSSWTAPKPSLPQSKLSLGVAIAAIGWGVVVVILAIVLPVYTVNGGRPGEQPRQSLVHVFGYRVLVPAAVPLLIAMTVTALVVSALRRHSAAPGRIAVVLASLTLLAGFVGFITIIVGMYTIPVGVLCLVAGAIAQTDARSSAPAQLADGSGRG